jgi:hypothetical protein
MTPPWRPFERPQTQYSSQICVHGCAFRWASSTGGLPMQAGPVSRSRRGDPRGQLQPSVASNRSEPEARQPAVQPWLSRPRRRQAAQPATAAVSPQTWPHPATDSQRQPQLPPGNRYERLSPLARRSRRVYWMETEGGGLAQLDEDSRTRMNASLCRREPRVCLTDVRTQSTRRVGRLPRGRRPVSLTWSRDGRYVAADITFSANGGDVYVVGVKDGATWRVTRTPGEFEGTITWGPTMARHRQRSAHSQHPCARDHGGGDWQTRYGRRSAASRGA